jgi:hypothetical protein
MSKRTLLGLLCLVAVGGSLVMAVRAAHDDAVVVTAPAATTPPGEVTVPGATVIVHKPGVAVTAQLAQDDEDGAEGADDDEDSEEAVPVSSVPDAVMKAALEALPGFEATEAEREQHKSGTTWSLEGTVDGKRCEIELSSSGEVLEIEGATDDG